MEYILQLCRVNATITPLHILNAHLQRSDRWASLNVLWQPLLCN